MFDPKQCGINPCECGGSGYTRRSDGQMVECLGSLRHRLKTYLTPFYENSPFIEQMKSSALMGRNVLISGIETHNFKSIFKTFLLKAGAKLSHQTVQGYDVIQSYVGSEGFNSMAELAAVDILVIFLLSDPPNKQYSDILLTLINKRSLSKAPTWVYTRMAPEHPDFVHKYGSSLSANLTDSKTFLRPVLS